MLDVEMLGHMGAERLDAVPLSGMMPRRNVGHAALRRDVHGLLGHFAAYEDIGAGGNGFIKKSLRAACAPRHATQFPIRVTEHERFATDFVFDRRGEMLER